MTEHVDRDDVSKAGAAASVRSRRSATSVARRRRRGSAAAVVSRREAFVALRHGPMTTSFETRHSPAKSEKTSTSRPCWIASSAHTSPSVPALELCSPGGLSESCARYGQRSPSNPPTGPRAITWICRDGGATPDTPVCRVSQVLSLWPLRFETARLRETTTNPLVSDAVDAAGSVLA